MNIALIWTCRLKRWKCRLPDVVGTKPLVVICYPTRWDRDTAMVTVQARSLQGQSVVHRNDKEILDVYFVDDGSYMIAHKQAAELVKRMRLLVATIVSCS